MTPSLGASLSPDSSRVAVGCSDNTVRVVDTAAGKEVLKITNHENWVLGTVFGVDGKRLVSVSRDQAAAKLTDASTGQFIRKISSRIARQSWRRLRAIPRAI